MPLRRQPEHSPLLRVQKPENGGARFSRSLRGTLVRPLDSVGCYVPQRPLSVAFHAADDGDSGAGLRGVPQIRVVSPRPAQATLAAASFLGVREFYRVLAEHKPGRGPLPMDEKHSAREQNRRSRQPVRDRGQETGWRSIRHPSF